MHKCRISLWLFAFAISSSIVPFMCGEDVSPQVKKAVERSRLDTVGTTPFHLVANLSPIRNDEPGVRGRVEIWWASPEHWRREVVANGFEQTRVVDGAKILETNSEDYFPIEALKLIEEVVNPIPPLDRVLRSVREGEVRHILGTTHVDWVTWGSDGTVRKSIGAGLILRKDGLLDYGGERDWGGEFSSYSGFHGKQIARMLIEGGTRADVVKMEDLQDADREKLNVTSSTPLPNQIRTVLVAEEALRKQVASHPEMAWPTVEQGPLEGLVISPIVIDRNGRVREVETVLSDNPGLNDAAKSLIKHWSFKPYLVDGAPVQVISTLTFAFRTTRPADMENFASARELFHKARTTGTLEQEGTAAFQIDGEIQASTSKGIAKGTYRKIWLAPRRWKREVQIGEEQITVSRDQDRVQISKSGKAKTALMLLRLMIDPIPEERTMVESDWRMKREMLEGTNTIRVASCYKSTEGVPDPEHFRGFWFATDGSLRQAYVLNKRVMYRAQMPFGEKVIPHEMRIYQNNALVGLIRLSSISSGVGTGGELQLQHADTTSCKVATPSDLLRKNFACYVE